MRSRIILTALRRSAQSRQPLISFVICSERESSFLIFAKDKERQKHYFFVVGCVGGLGERIRLPQGTRNSELNNDNKRSSMQRYRRTASVAVTAYSGTAARSGCSTRFRPSIVDSCSYTVTCTSCDRLWRQKQNAKKNLRAILNTYVLWRRDCDACTCIRLRMSCTPALSNRVARLSKTHKRANEHKCNCSPWRRDAGVW
jgi:hypothetical protein